MRDCRKVFSSKFFVQREPFAHLRLDSVVPAHTADELVGKLTKIDDWRRVKRDFYEIEVLASPERLLGADIRCTLAARFAELRAAASEHLGLELNSSAQLQIHRLASGAGIGLHSDAADSAFRFVVVLQAREASTEGGHFLLVDPLTRYVTIVTPTHNSGLAFPTSGTLHAVSEQRAGTRFSIVARFQSALNLKTQG